MLKTNSKQAKDNLKSYIMTAWNLEPEDQGRTWAETQKDIKESFIFQAYSSKYERKQNKQEAFKDWLSGLPHGLGDFFLCQAVEDLGSILNQTEAERAKYTEDQACETLSYLIYREVMH